MTLADHIEINPKVLLGKPVVRGTRVPFELILRKLGEGAADAVSRRYEYGSGGWPSDPRLAPHSPLSASSPCR